MKRMNVGLAVSMAAALLFLASGSSANAGQEHAVRAFMAWQSQGQMMRTGPNQAMFTGLLSGEFYIDGDQGPMDAGEMTCPFAVYAKLDDGSQRAFGQCVLTDGKGNSMYIDVACAGTALVGCDGQSTVTGGTGELEHATGGGKFVVRSSAHTFLLRADAALNETGRGIIFWPQLQFKTP